MNYFHKPEEHTLDMLLTSYASFSDVIGIKNADPELSYKHVQRLGMKVIHKPFSFFYKKRAMGSKSLEPR